MTDARAYLKAQDFGVVGDGKADDSPALTAMLAEFGPSNDPYLGGTILLPKGRFRLASSFKINKNIRLVGAGGVGNSASVLVADANADNLCSSRPARPTALVRSSTSRTPGATCRAGRTRSPQQCELLED
jgi:hypothetical protein